MFEIIRKRIAHFPTYTLAGLPSGGSAGRILRVTDDSEGLWMDNGANYFALNLNVINAAEKGLSPNNSAADNDTAWSAIMTAIHATGGRIEIPTSEDPYDFETTIAPASPVYIKAMGNSHLDNGAQEVRPVTLRWTGGASVAISFSGTGASGSVLEGIFLDNSGTGTVGIDIDAGAGAVQLRSVTIAPATPFSNSAVRIGNTGSVSFVSLRDVCTRAAAPYGLRIAHVSAHITLYDCHIMDSSTTNVLLGTTTTEVESFHALGCTFEQLTNLDAVFIQRVQHVSFDHCYFESGGAGYAIHIPTTCTVADAVQVDHSWFTGIATLPAHIINCDFSGATLNASHNTVVGGVTTSFIRNNNCRRIYGAGNKFADAITFVNSRTRVTEFASNANANGSQQANVDGTFSIGDGAPISAVLSATTTWDPGSLADGAVASTNVTCTGATILNCVAMASFSPIVGSGWIISASVTGDNTVTVTILNKTTITADLASGTLRVTVIKF